MELVNSKELGLKKKKLKDIFKIGDFLIFGIFTIFFLVLGLKITKQEEYSVARAEVYVDNVLKYTQKLKDVEKTIFVETEIGGVDIEFKDDAVRVVTSNSPRKIAVKEGWKKTPGDVIIGIPDKLVIKIIGEEGESELDYVAK